MVICHSYVRLGYQRLIHRCVCVKLYGITIHYLEWFHTSHIQFCGSSAMTQWFFHWAFPGDGRFSCRLRFERGEMWRCGNVALYTEAAAEATYMIEYDIL